MSDFIDKLMLDKTYSGLTKALDLNWRRNDAITSNIANAETPQYRATDVSFAGELEKAFEAQTSPTLKTNPLHVDTSDQDGNAHLVPDFTGATRSDGNNVDIDVQMGKLAKVSGDYASSANFIRKKLSLIREALRSA